MARWLAILSLAVALCATAHAQGVQRLLPANGKLGTLVGKQHAFPLIQINDKVVRMAPGALVFDENNRTVLHGLLPERAQVLFVSEANGDVTRIYILRPDELETVKRILKP